MGTRGGLSQRNSPPTVSSGARHGRARGGELERGIRHGRARGLDHPARGRGGEDWWWWWGAAEPVVVARGGAIRSEKARVCFACGFVFFFFLSLYLSGSFFPGRDEDEGAREGIR